MDVCTPDNHLKTGHKPRYGWRGRSSSSHPSRLITSCIPTQPGENQRPQLRSQGQSRGGQLRSCGRAAACTLLPASPG